MSLTWSVLSAAFGIFKLLRNATVKIRISVKEKSQQGEMAASLYIKTEEGSSHAGVSVNANSSVSKQTLELAPMLGPSMDANSSVSIQCLTELA